MLTELNAALRIVKFVICWNRLDLHPSEMQSVLVDHEVSQLN